VSGALAPTFAVPQLVSIFLVILSAVAQIAPLEVVEAPNAAQAPSSHTQI